MEFLSESFNSISWPCLFIIVTLLISLFFLPFQHGKVRKQNLENLPPGPPRIPIIGNLHQLGKLPHLSLYKLSQKYGPVLHLKLGQVPVLVISSPEMAKEVLKTHDLKCCDRPDSYGIKKLSYNRKDISFCPYGDYWREMRKLCVIELFTVKRVRSFQHVRGRAITNFINILSEQASDPNKDNIKAVFMDLFIASIDTTSNTIVWAMSELSKNPRVMQKVQTEIRNITGNKSKVDESEIEKLKYIKMVIKETLRLHPAAPLLLPRESMQHCKIGGYNVYPKTRIFVNVWAIGRDSNTWSNPEEFYPERFEKSEIDFKGHHYEFIPFGAGRRMCPGITMGLASVESILANLLHCFDWELPKGMKPEDVNMEEEVGLTINKKFPLYLVPIKH